MSFSRDILSALFHAPLLLPALLLLTVLHPSSGSAAFELPQSIDFKGSVKNESAYRLKSPNRFSKIQNNLETEINYYPVDGLMFYSKTRFIYDAVYEFVSDYGGAPYRSYRLNWNFNELFPELYMEYAPSDDFIITAGRQQIVWGEAVGLKITDIVNPTDFREFILDDFLDSRIGLWMLRINYSFGESMIEGLLIPDFEPARPAEAGSEWEIKSPFAGGSNIIHKTELPGDGFKNPEVGARFNTILNSWDISFYYLYSWSDIPAFHILRSGKTANIFPRHHRVHTTGGTFNYALGRMVFSGEIAVSANSYFTTKDPSDADGVTKRDSLNYMLGTEYILNNFTNISFQFIQNFITGNTGRLLDDKFNTTLTLFVQMDFLNETLKPDMLVLYGANSGDFIFRPSMIYDVNDDIKVKIGLDIFHGPAKGFFGQFSNNDRAYIELKRSF